jgi:hypothetical protein
MFIEKAIRIHGDKYDYTKAVYVNSNSKIIIICKKHGEFEQNIRRTAIVKKPIPFRSFTVIIGMGIQSYFRKRK